jgi:hypothetical protein
MKPNELLRNRRGKRKRRGSGGKLRPLLRSRGGGRPVKGLYITLTARSSRCP